MFDVNHLKNEAVVKTFLSRVENLVKETEGSAIYLGAVDTHLLCMLAGEVALAKAWRNAPVGSVFMGSKERISDLVDRAQKRLKVRSPPKLTVISK